MTTPSRTLLTTSGVVLAATLSVTTPLAVAAESSRASETSEPASTSTSTSSATSSTSETEPGSEDCVDLFALAVQGTGQSSPDSPPDMDTGFLGNLFSSLTSGQDALPGSDAADSAGTGVDTAGDTAATSTTSASESSSASSAEGSDDADDEPSTATFDREYIPYDSSMGGMSMDSNSAPQKSVSYKQSVSGGADTLSDRATEILDECPDTKLIPVGYSQGADVVDKFLSEVGTGASEISSDAIAAGAVFGSPRRGDGMEVLSGGQSHPKSTDELEDINAPAAEGAGILPETDHINGYGDLDGKVGQFCTQGDLVCSMPTDSPLARTVSKAVTNVDLSGGDPFQVLSDLGDAFALTPAQAASDMVNEDIEGESLETVEIDPKKSISQRLEDASSNPVATTGDGDSDSDSADATAGENTEAAESSSAAASSSTAGGDEGSSSAEPSESGSGSAVRSGSEASEPTAGAAESAAGDLAGDVLDSAGEAAVGAAGAAGADQRTLDVAGDAAKAVSKLGVLGTNAAVTVAKKTFTPENIAQVASVGLANPQAGLALLGGKVAASATEVVAPVGMEAASSAFKYAESEVEDNEGLIQMATDVTYWNHWQNHTSYTSTPVTEQGTSAMDYTAEWIKALASESADDEDGEASSSESTSVSSSDSESSSEPSESSQTSESASATSSESSSSTTEPTDDTDSDN